MVRTAYFLQGYTLSGSVCTCIIVNAVAGKVAVEDCHKYFSTETSSQALIEKKEMVNFI